KYELQLKKGGSLHMISVEKFFREISEVLVDYPIQLFLTACRGGSVSELEDSYLPKNSVVVSLAPYNADTEVHDIEPLSKALRNKALSPQVNRNQNNAIEALELLYVY